MLFYLILTHSLRYGFKLYIKEPVNQNREKYCIKNLNTLK